VTSADIPITFAGGPLNRCGELREDRDAIAAAFADPATRFVPVWRYRCLADGVHAALASRDELGDAAPSVEETIFLGQQDGRFLFAARLPDEPEPALQVSGVFIELREAMSRLAADDASLVAYARAMFLWQDRHRHCGCCGQLNRPQLAGFVMACTDTTGCGHRSFPRLDPAIIVLVHDGDRCLLGRQPSWPDDRFSTIAGFVEPGESLEDAVLREVHEETNIRVRDCRYLASQPWPFPAALMIGFHASAEPGEIRLNDGELAEARWLTREQIVARDVVLPPDTSVAFRLIEAWFDRPGEPGLAALGLAGPALRVRRPGDAGQR
jgi:NAD+ diphosphatase